MAMYYQSSSEIQGDGLQTVYLMNPNNIGYSDTQPRFNMLFSNPTLVPHAPPPPPPQYISAHHYSMGGSGNNLQTPRGLSLSLAAHYQQTGGDHDFRAGQSMISPNNSSSPPNGGANTMQSAIMGSKYLKAAQELLDEVVSVGNHRTDKVKPIIDPTAAANKEAPSANKGGTNLTTAQKQEIQMKKAKLHSMLDEVEQRCRQYNHQMQMTIAAFEQAAGTGSARSYTQVALKTILKQFRCLKSTISAQMKGLNKNLGEEEGSELSRLRFVDRQQVGMVHNNAWRPQRGLPERAVSLLRAWLFQHFLHPYPKDSDKQMLAKQTGLTKSQVSNWFINARVLLWKPMVEEMYLAIKPEPTPEVSPPPSLPASTNVAQLISSLKKPRSSFVNLSAADQRFSTDSCLPMAAAENITRYGTCSGRGTGSLSLGLPFTERFLSHRSFELGTRIESAGVVEGEGAYEMMDFQNRKPFPPQLLPDFVA